MKIGTKSLLFGGHQFLIHPFFVALAWVKLYGVTFDPRIWLSIFVHDWGYWGKVNMDGKEGKTHPELGAKIMSIFDYRFLVKKIKTIYKDYPYYTNSGWKSIYKIRHSVLMRKSTKTWYNFTVYHSRFYCKKDKVTPSKLCLVDKLAFILTPTWLYVPLCTLTGEIEEYQKDSKLGIEDKKEWMISAKRKTLRWLLTQKDSHFLAKRFLNKYPNLW